MADPKVGLGGHISYLVLAPKVDHVEKTESRDENGEILYRNGVLQNGPVLVDHDVMTAETFPTGETNCQAATIVGVNADGTVNAAGWNATGTPRAWINAVVGGTPAAREDDPAGHVFHDTCPFGR